MEDLLKDLAEGRINIEQAKEELERRLFGQEFSNIDTGRVRRTGIPEVVLAEGKTGKQISDISQQFLDRTSRVIVSRLSEERSDDLISDLLECYDDLIVRYEPLPGFLVAHTDEMKVEATGGKVAILTA